MAAELGQTTDPKALIPGEPEQIAKDLRQMVGNIQAIDGIGNNLRGIDPAQWTGAASTAFREAFSAEPPKWLQAVDVAGQNGRSLADFADTLT
jgi:hypothetical protein